MSFSKGWLWLELGSSCTRGPQFVSAGQEISAATKWGMILFVVTWKVRECEGKWILNCCSRSIVAFCIACEYCPEKSLPCLQLNPLLWYKLANQCLPKPNKHLQVAFVSSSLKGRSCHEPVAAFQSNVLSSGILKKISVAISICLCLKILQIWFAYD